MEDEQVLTVANQLSLEASIIQDVPCLYCGYNLRTLSLAGKCPECGNGVLRSYRGDLLRYSNLPWLERIHRGSCRMVWATVTLMAAVMFAIVANGYRFCSTWHPFVLLFIIYWSYYVLVVLGPVSAVFGVWLFTAPEPDYAGPHPLGTLQRVVRVAVTMTSLGLIVGLLAAIIYWENSSVFVSDSALLFIYTCILSIFLVRAMVLLVYMRRLAARTPKKDIGQFTKMLLLVLGVRSYPDR